MIIISCHFGLPSWTLSRSKLSGTRNAYQTPCEYPGPGSRSEFLLDPSGDLDGTWLIPAAKEEGGQQGNGSCCPRNAICGLDGRSYSGYHFVDGNCPDDEQAPPFRVKHAGVGVQAARALIVRTPISCVEMPRILLLTTLALSSCADSAFVNEVPMPALTRFSTDSLAAFDLSGRVFTGSDSLANPSLIAVGGTQIYVGDTKASRSLHVFNRRTGELVGSFGERGQGAREIGYLWSLDFKPGSDAGWLFDLSPRTMHFFDGDSLTDRTVTLQGEGTPMNPTWIAGDSIASVGMYMAGRLALYGPDGRFSRFKGTDPPGDPEIPTPVRNHAYDGKIQTNSGGTRIAVGAIHTDRLEIYDLEGLRHLVRGPVFQEPEYTLHGDDQGNSWLSIDDETTYGYVSVAATDELIFGLYSGRTMGWTNDNGWWSPPGEAVIVFAWTGQPLAVLNIEDGALMIGISASGDDLYAIYHKPAPRILHYQVPEIG